MNRKFALGCGCLVFVVIATIALGIFSARNVFQKGKTWITAQTGDTQQRSAIESAWQPPTTKPDARWFPAAVDQWTLSISEDISTVPDLQLDRPGHRGKYRGVCRRRGVLCAKGATHPSLGQRPRKRRYEMTGG